MNFDDNVIQKVLQNHLKKKIMIKKEKHIFSYRWMLASMAGEENVGRCDLFGKISS